MEKIDSYLIDSDREREKIKTVILKLMENCRQDDWAGWDPYDALNSRLFELLPFLNFGIPRLVFTQLLKRSPVNIRKFLLIPKTQNPKALAIFLSAAIKLSRLGLIDDNVTDQLVQKIITLRSPGEPYWCWGYSFPWQGRYILTPRGAPNLVCTTFVANALLDAYEASGDNRLLQIAENTADYIVNELYYDEGTGVCGYSYPTPDSHSRVHNANFLGAALLHRVFKHNGKEYLLQNALEVTRFSAGKQQDNGSWYYGEHPSEQWIDNFHTGYNLCALENMGIPEFKPHIEKGYQYYINHFFRKDGSAKYFHDNPYPLDIHSVAQSIITLVLLRSYDSRSLLTAGSVYNWTMQNMWSEDGYFYYRITPYGRNKISYIRWSQAWMLYALTIFYEMHQSEKVRN